MLGTSQNVYLNLPEIWDDFRDNCSVPKRSYPQMPTLTDTQIRDAKSAARPVRLYDDRGLYLEVSPKGGRWWRLKYSFEGNARLLSLGTYLDTGLKATLSMLARRQPRAGSEPAGQRCRDHAHCSVGAACRAGCRRSERGSSVAIQQAHRSSQCGLRSTGAGTRPHPTVERLQGRLAQTDRAVHPGRRHHEALAAEV